jgi:hypothetical protein
MTLHHSIKRDIVPRRIFAAALITSVLIFFLMVTGCTQSSGATSGHSNPVWETTELTDVRTGEVFTVSSLSDRPVLIQSFIVTCPICMKQQEEITRLAESGDIPFVMIGLDIDPNSDMGLLRQYTEQKGYVGRYARSSPSMTQSLVDQFGMTVLSPAQAPLILVCPDGTATLLPSGIKTMPDLKQALAGCPG